MISADFICIQAALIPVRNIKTDCRALVPATPKETRNNYVPSSVGLMISALARLITVPSEFQKSIIIGTILGDANLRITSNSINAIYIHAQAFFRSSYSWMIFTKLQNLCASFPSFKQPKFKDQTFYSTHVCTRAYPFITDIYNAFYIKGIKIIPTEYLFLNMTPVVLAYLIIDDGSAHGNGLRIITNAFSLFEVTQLAGILHYHYGIICTIQNRKGVYVLYIRKESMDVVRALVVNYMHPIFYYKIGL